MTKSLLILLFGLVLAQAAILTDEQRSKLLEISKKCSAETGVKITQIAANHSRLKDDPKMQKYVGCMLRTVGVVNEKGEIQVDTIRTKLRKNAKMEQVLKVVRECDKSVQSDDPDERAYLLYRCFLDGRNKFNLGPN